MNYFDIIFVLIILLLTYAGYRKGLFITLLELARFVVGIPLCFVVSDTYSNQVYQALVRPRALESIKNAIANSSSVKEITSAIEEATSSLPSFISSSIDLSSINFKKTDVAEQILTKAFEPSLIALTKGGLFLVCFIAFFGVTGIALRVFRRMRARRRSKKSETLLSKGDRLLGAGFGICKSFVTIIALTSILLYIQSISGEETSKFIAQIEGSRLLPIIDSINPINFLIGG